MSADVHGKPMLRAPAHLIAMPMGMGDHASSSLATLPSWFNDTPESKRPLALTRINIHA